MRTARELLTIFDCEIDGWIKSELGPYVLITPDGSYEFHNNEDDAVAAVASGFSGMPYLVSKVERPKSHIAAFTGVSAIAD